MIIQYPPTVHDTRINYLFIVLPIAASAWYEGSFLSWLPPVFAVIENHCP